MDGIDLRHGDCLELMQDIPDGSIDLILCDLPYGMVRACHWDSAIPFEPLWHQYRRIIKSNGVIALFGSQPFTSALIMSNTKMFKYEWIWEKTSSSNFMHSNFQPLKAHESILIFTNGGTAAGSKAPCTYNKQYEKGEPYNRGFVKSGSGTKDKGFRGAICNNETGDRTPRSVIKFSNPKGKAITIHPTQKPVPLLEYLIKTYTNEGETVLDNCFGSGSTAIAALNTNRKFIGIEKDDKYFEIASKRIMEHLR